MNEHRALTGLSLLCALAFCAIAAPSASAADGKGTTQFTCIAGQTNDFSDEHCNVSSAGGGKGHSTVATGTATSLQLIQTENLVLTGTIGGLKTIIICKKASATGTQTNSEPSTGFHTVAGTGIKFVLTECTTTIGGASCPMGSVEAPDLISHDVENAHGFKMGIKFEPKNAGNPIAQISIGPCKATGEKTLLFTLEGSFMGLPEGATLKFTKASTEPTLKLGGQKATLTGTLTITNSTSKTPITFTTTDKDRAN